MDIQLFCYNQQRHAIDLSNRLNPYRFRTFSRCEPNKICYLKSSIVKLKLLESLVVTY